MNKARIYEELIVAFATTALATALALSLDAVTANRQLSLMAVVLVVAMMVCIYMYVFYGREKDLLGIRRIFKTLDDAPKTLELIENVKHSVDFLGISARTFFESEEVEESMKRRIKEGCVFRFLLLDPKAPYLEAKAKDEGDDPEAWRHDIEASILRLERVGKETDPSKVRIRLYNSLPIWRLLFADEELIQVTYYPHGHRGRHSPVFLLGGKKISLFDPFRSFFDYVWSVSNEP
ncbi:MAG: DUF5919 domain-containing protein [Candidatus Bathyarchaeia archaeon]|jgi:hypothetical protein